MMKLGMYLPCHVVITKMDMLPGFSEYFCDLNKDAANAVFGWRNSSGRGRFDDKSFTDYWKDLVRKLHDGLYSVMLGKTVHQHNINTQETRLALTGGMYLFPDEFEKIGRNLFVYLKNIFGHNAWLDNRRILLSGVYFTSSKDGHVRLSESFAKIMGKPIESAPVIIKKVPNDQPRFIHDLLGSLIFEDSKSGAFSRFRLIIKHIPQYLICLFLLGSAVFFSYAAFSDNGQIRETLNSSQQALEISSDLFSRNSFLNSPLLTTSKGEIVLAKDHPMKDFESITRMQCYFETQLDAFEDIDVPWGFRIADHLYFNGAKYGSNDRTFIVERIRAQMLLRPLLNLTVERLIGPSGRQEPFTMQKREVFMTLAELGQICTQKQFQNRSITMTPYMKYLLPQLPVITVDMVANPPISGAAGKIDVMELFLKLTSQKRGLGYIVTEQMLEKWKKLQMYPSSQYVTLRTVLLDGDEYLKNISRIRSLAQPLANTKKDEDRAKILAELHELAVRQVKLSNEMNDVYVKGFPQWKLEFEGKRIVKKIPDKNNDALYWPNAIHEYETLMEQDFQFLTSTSEMMLTAVPIPEWQEKTSRFMNDIQKSYQVTKDSFQKEQEKLKKIYVTARDSKFFGTEALKAADNESQIPVFMLDVQMMQLVDSLADSQQKNLTAIEHYFAEKEALEQLIALKQKQFSDLVQQQKDNSLLSKQAAVYKTILDARINLMRNMLLKQLFALYPKSVDALKVAIQGQSKMTGEVLGMKQELMVETFGQLHFDKAYDPAIARKYIEPVSSLLPPPEADGQNKTAKQDPVPESLRPEFDAIRAVLSDYLAKYVTYWSIFVDRIEVEQADWKSFHDFCKKLKPYQVNTLLFVAYSTTTDILGQCPDALLSDNAANSKKQALITLNIRRQVLSPHFSEICNDNVAAWKNLPDSEEQAFLVLQRMSPQQRAANFFAIFDSGAKGDIPWWSDFIRTGIKLLSRATSKLMFERFSSYKERLFSFPLCADSPYSVPLDTVTLKEISGYLSDIGCPFRSADPVNTEGKPDAKADSGKEKKDQQQMLFTGLINAEQMDAKLPEWGAKLQLIIDALTNDIKPMTWSLLLPSRDVQIKLTDALGLKNPLAIDRYPYLSLKTAKIDAGAPLYARSVAKQATLASGLVEDSDIRINFFSRSDATEPQTTFAVPDAWAILRLYLSKKTYFDPQSQTSYSAIMVKDNDGIPFVLWLGFKFNKLIPLPDEWPTLQNCPDFSQIQHAVKQKPLSGSNFTQYMLTIPEGPEGLKHLNDILKNNRITSYPTAKLYPLPFTAGSEWGKIYAEYPFAVVQTPNRSVHLNLTAAEQGNALVTLNDGEIRILLFKHADDKKPEKTITVPGPYPMLRLVTTPGKKHMGNVLVISLRTDDGKTVVPFRLVF